MPDINHPPNNTSISEDSQNLRTDTEAQSANQHQNIVLQFIDKLKPIFSHPVYSFFLGILVSATGFYLKDYWAPYVFNTPRVSFVSENISAVDPAIYNESTIDINLDTLVRMSAEGPDNVGKMARYSVVCGDAENPGYGNFVLRLENRGKAQAGLRQFEIFVLDYHPLSSEFPAVEKESAISKPNDYIELYGTVDPLINSSEAWRVHQTDSGEIELPGIPINTSLSPGEHGTYYLQTSFLKYGYYKLAFKVTYVHKGKNYFRRSKEPVYILYVSPNCLPD